VNAVAVLSASGLVKRYQTARAVDGVDLELRAGEVRGLLGPNGAGKTTLLRMLLGLVACDAGSIELLGHSVQGPGAHPMRGVAGFVEDPSFYPYLSARANLEVLAHD
jgi:ABC-2 type transport system ATP-binding protein